MTHFEFSKLHRCSSTPCEAHHLTIWRVVDASGNGIFADSEVLEGFRCKYGDYTAYPSPVSDRGIGRPPLDCESCACADLDQLSYWFDDPIVIDELVAHNAKILKLSVPPYSTVVGDKQVLFDREHAKIIEEFPAHKFHELTRPEPDNQLQLAL